ncbi:MAG: tetratricopeptide repeat protein [Planctomycetes bacterium]|nr:tetratricopeptide repeat protein [Planctomycetota bacterium]MCC7170427.1 tetratricopeptide repeat protein [Planctomycetota bacterium]
MIAAVALVVAALAFVQDGGRAATARLQDDAIEAKAPPTPPTLREVGQGVLERSRSDGFAAVREDVARFVDDVIAANVYESPPDIVLGDVLDALLEQQITLAAALQDHELMTSTAVALALVGSGERGVARLEAAVAMHDATFACVLAAGHVRSARDDANGALELYERASALRPDSSLPWHDRGATLGRLGRFPQALEAFDAALRIDPTNAGAQFNRAIVLEKLDRAGDAEQAYRTLASGDTPYAPRAALNLGTILVRRGDREGARTAYERCVELDPDSASGRHNLGALLVELGEDAAAKPHLERAATLRPNDPRPLALLGQIADDAGDVETAERHLRAALRCDPRFQSARYRLAQLLRRSGRAEAAKEFEDAS